MCLGQLSLFLTYCFPSISRVADFAPAEGEPGEHLGIECRVVVTWSFSVVTVPSSPAVLFP
ncbi:hypothetical protein E2C01_087304 [Portunus trituberculatus]|uniref:Uncharacterized protein n=1 Tax=Portunus trituberculatus TaxID=210409 RepID=A0A5B7JFT8_PORTR|nr:hypothetical protein [Portunus trituberculatus]